MIKDGELQEIYIVACTAYALHSERQ